MEPRLRNSSGPVEAMPKHKQAGQTTVLTKMTANIDRKRLQCRSYPQMPLTAASRCCNAARRTGHSLQQQNHMIGEFADCGTKRQFAATTPMAAFKLERVKRSRFEDHSADDRQRAQRLLPKASLFQASGVDLQADRSHRRGRFLPTALQRWPYSRTQHPW